MRWQKRESCILDALVPRDNGFGLLMNLFFMGEYCDVLEWVGMPGQVVGTHKDQPQVFELWVKHKVSPGPLGTSLSPGIRYCEVSFP